MYNIAAVGRGVTRRVPLFRLTSQHPGPGPSLDFSTLRELRGPFAAFAWKLLHDIPLPWAKMLASRHSNENLRVCLGRGKFCSFLILIDTYDTYCMICMYKLVQVPLSLFNGSNDSVLDCQIRLQADGS